MQERPAVHGSFNYTLDNGIVPEIYFYDPGPDVKAHEPGDDPREMPVFDGWPRVDDFSLDREGFALRTFHSSFEGFSDDALIQRVFYPQVEAFVRDQVGAQRVKIFDHTIRAKVNEANQNTDINTSRRAPVRVVHCDYTPNSGPLRVRQVLPEEAERLLGRRVAFYNFWLPLRNPVEEMPLAMCDVTSAAPEDLLTMVLRYRERTGEIFVMRHAASHKWWYFPRMQPHHCLLLKTYDSECDGRARFMAHSAFDDPDTPQGARMRESIEIRTMAFY